MAIFDGIMTIAIYVLIPLVGLIIGYPLMITFVLYPVYKADGGKMKLVKYLKHMMQY